MDTGNHYDELLSVVMARTSVRHFRPNPRQAGIHRLACEGALTPPLVQAP